MPRATLKYQLKIPPKRDVNGGRIGIVEQINESSRAPTSVTERPPAAGARESNHEGGASATRTVQDGPNTGERNVNVSMCLRTVRVDGKLNAVNGSQWTDKSADLIVSKRVHHAVEELNAREAGS
jgi:hypothetical protein